MEDRDYLELMLAKINKLEQAIYSMKETLDAHRVEHGFQKMQDGGVNSQFGGATSGYGMGGGMTGMGGPMGPGPGIGGPDPSRPPGM